MEPKGGDKPSNRKSSRGVSRCRKQSSRQYERALPLAIPEIRPWGGVSKYKESAYGDVSSPPVHRELFMRRSHDADGFSAHCSVARNLANSLFRYVRLPSNSLVSRPISL